MSTQRLVKDSTVIFILNIKKLETTQCPSTIGWINCGRVIKMKYSNKNLPCNNADGSHNVEQWGQTQEYIQSTSINKQNTPIVTRSQNTDYLGEGIKS